MNIKQVTLPSICGSYRSTNMTHLCKGFFNKEKIVKFLSDNTPEIYKSVLRENKLEGLLN